jgi:hypothetical protein
MKYQVSGAHRGTGARMVLEFEADSKAAAERKARQAGMEVHRVADVTAGDGMTEPELGTGGRRTGAHPVLTLVALLIVAVVAYYVWTMVRGGR